VIINSGVNIAQHPICCVELINTQVPGMYIFNLEIQTRDCIYVAPCQHMQ